MDPVTQCVFAPHFDIYMTYKNGSSFKFWRARSINGTYVQIQYGRIGTYGTSITKDRLYFEKTAPKKINKGYEVETCYIGQN